MYRLIGISSWKGEHKQPENFITHVHKFVPMQPELCPYTCAASLVSLGRLKLTLKLTFFIHTAYVHRVQLCAIYLDFVLQGKKLVSAIYKHQSHVTLSVNIKSLCWGDRTEKYLCVLCPRKEVRLVFKETAEVKNPNSSFLSSLKYLGNKKTRL